MALIVNRDSTHISQPRLLLPNQQPAPIGKLRVDRLNDLSYGLLCYVVPYKNIMLDITYGMHSGIWGAGSLGSVENYNGIIVNAGLGAYADSNNECIRSTVAVTPPTDYTALVRYKRMGPRPDYYYLMYCQDYQAFSFYYDKVDQWFVDGYKIETSGKTEANMAERFYNMVVTCVNGSTKAIYFDDGTVYSASGTNSARASDFLCIGGRDDATARYGAGYLPLYGLWDHVLDSTKIESLLRDPYQLVIG